MYFVSWKLNGIYKNYLANSWREALDVYNQQYKESGVSDLEIEDMEYGVFYRDHQWQQTDTFQGWSGNAH